MEHEILTIQELADYLRVHYTTIYRLVRKGGLPAFRVGSEWRFNRAAVEQWLKSQNRDGWMPATRRGKSKDKSSKKA